MKKRRILIAIIVVIIIVALYVIGRIYIEYMPLPGDNGDDFRMDSNVSIIYD